MNREKIDEEIDVEWLILADAAQVVGGKLYLLGGGWDRLTVNSGFPVSQNVAVALSLLVPWNRTNEQHSFQIEIITVDSEKLAKIEGAFEVGRRPRMPKGQPQRTQVATGMLINFKMPGEFVIIASVDGEQKQRFPFYVEASPALQAQMQRNQMKDDSGE